MRKERPRKGFVAAFTFSVKGLEAVVCPIKQRPDESTIDEKQEPSLKSERRGRTPDKRLSWIHAGTGNIRTWSCCTGTEAESYKKHYYSDQFGTPYGFNGGKFVDVLPDVSFFNIK